MRKLFAATGVLLLGLGAAATAQPRPQPDATAGASVAAEPPTVEVIPPSGPWELGRPREIRILIRHDPRLQVFFPEHPAMPGFVLREVRDRRRPGPGGEVERELTLLMVPVRLDQIRLPSIEVAWRSPQDATTSGTVEVKLGRITVRPQFPDPTSATLGNAPGGLPVLHRNTVLIVGGVAMAAALVAALLTWFLVVAVRRRLAARVRPRPPADRTALGALDSLARDRALLRLDPMAWMTRLSGILRTYLGERYGIDGLEATTTEIVAWAERRRPAGLGVLTLRELLGAMDLVKFASRRLDEEESTRLLDEARETVVRTAEKPEERAARAARALALVPGGRERAFGLTVDLLVGGVLAGGFHLAGGLGEEPWLIAAGGGVLGLWLLLRDLFGRSPGKAAAGLRLRRSRRRLGSDDATLDEGLRSMTPSALLLRNLPLALVVTLPAEVVAYLLLPHGRRLGDVLARTRVLRERSGGRSLETGPTLAAALLAATATLLPPIWALLQLRGGSP